MTSVRGTALLFTMGLLIGCDPAEEPGAGGAESEAATPVEASAAPDVFWNSATIYFLLTDRFRNGDPSNDGGGRPDDAALLRGFEGGDLAGVLEMLRAGYFDALGVRALWMTPFTEQIRGGVDEGTGRSYGYHGYWAKDWTAVEPSLGTADDLRAVVDEAHARGIRVIMDAVINHPGAGTDLDEPWPSDWIRLEPPCTYRDYETTVTCNLVPELPDFLTESDAPVELPGFLVEKWSAEGRLDREQAELDAFFERTGHPRAPRYYVMKWLTDWVREYGFDGYRVDTAKHFEEGISAELAAEARQAFDDWKAAHPDQVLDDRPFWMMAEVYNYELRHGRDFGFGDRTVDFYDHGYDALINFGFKGRARDDLDAMYADYAAALRTGPLQGLSTVNYASSHDDGGPLDRERAQPYRTGTALLLAPGAAQIYYGDELARPLVVDGAEGDANLRSFMNWDALDESGGEAAALLEHWRTLGRFRAAHPAVGAGAHARLQAEPYVFSRTLDHDGVNDRVVVAIDLPAGEKTVPVGDVFADGQGVVDAYTGTTATVAAGAVTLDTPSPIVLLEAAGGN